MAIQSPSINHVFMEDYSDDDHLDDEEVNFESSGEDYAGGLITPSVENNRMT
jgi:hypothetical protein